MPRRLKQAGEKDCWVTCIAMLTDLPLEPMRALVPTSERYSKWNAYYRLVRRFCRENGWLLVETGPEPPRGFAIAGGPVNKTYYHVVVVKDGKLWQNPGHAKLLQVEFHHILIPLA